MNLQELRTKRLAVVASMRAMIDDTDTELDEEAYKAKQVELDRFNSQIKRSEDLAKTEAALAVPEPSVGASAVLDPAPAPTSHPRRNGAEPKTEWEAPGEFLHATFRGTDPRLHYVEIDAEQRMDGGSEGGFAVPTIFRPDFMRVDPAETPLLAMVRNLGPNTPPDAEVSMPALDQSGDAPDNQFGGVKTSWIGEADTKPETEGKIREVKLKPQELAGHIKVTEKLLRNWAGAGAFYTDLLRGALNAAQEAALFSGNGVAKPQGLLGADATIVINRDTADTVKYADLTKMVTKMLMRGGMGTWLITQALMEDILQLKNDNNNLIFIADNAVPGVAGSLMGRPIVWYEYAEARGSLGDITLVQPSPYYLLQPGSGPFIEVGRANDDFLKNKSRIKIFTNVDGQPWLTAPYKLRNGFKVSPFVALDVPAV